MTNYEIISLILTLVSITAGPAIGIQVQKYLERKETDKEQKSRVFFTLMATRMERLSYEHVKALNSIILSFHTYDKKSKEQKVLDRWKEYHAILCDENLQKNHNDQWLSRKSSGFIDLLYEMSQCLGYVYDKGEIEKGCYGPVAHETFDQNQITINTGLAEIVSGQKPLSVRFSEDKY